MRLNALFLLFFLKCSVAEMNEEAAMVVSVINAMERPSSIIATLCWSLESKVELFEVLAKNISAHKTQFLSEDTAPERREKDEHVVFLVDLMCSHVSEYFDKSWDLKNFRSPFRWFLIDKFPDGQENSVIPQAIRNIYISVDSEVILARKTENGTYVLQLIYKVSPKHNWIFEDYGIWSEDTGFTRSRFSTVPLAKRRLNLKGTLISISYVLTYNDSVNHLEDGIDNHIDTVTKVTYFTNHHLLDLLNASRRIRFADTWGYFVNNSWNGMTGDLVRAEAEIGGTPMFFTPARMGFVEYVTSPTPTRSKFVFQQPKLSYENNLFLLSFRTSVWYSSIALVALLLLALFAAAAWEWEKYKGAGDRDTDSRILRASFSDVVILVLGATCQQGTPVELKGSLGRIVMLVLFLALMFLYTSYAANIVALLQSSSSQIKNLEDLLHSRLKIGVHDNVFNRYYFPIATEPIRKALYEVKIAPPGAKPRFMSMEDGVKLMKKGLFAFHMETGVGYKFVGKYFEEGEKCGLKEMEYFQAIDPWLAVRKNTPYKEMFKIGFKRMQEHGLQTRENHRLYEKKPRCANRGANFVSVSMVDCYPAVMVLAYGVVASLMLLVMECLWNRRETLVRGACGEKKQEHF